MTTTFETVKLGDRVWECQYGYGKVIEIYPAGFNEIGQLVIRGSFIVSFGDEGRIDRFMIDGRRYPGDNNTLQTLFWDDPRFNIPEKPKIFVKKKIEAITLGVEIYSNYDRLTATAQFYIPSKSKNLKFYCECEVEE